MSWAITRSGTSTAAFRLPASCTWRTYSDGSGRYRTRNTCRLNSTAGKAAFEIIKDLGIKRPGVQVYVGDGEDAGKFAIGFSEYTGRDAFSAALLILNHSNGSAFAAASLVRLQPTGYSLLTREGDLLVGKFGKPMASAPHMKNRGKKKPPTKEA